MNNELPGMLAIAKGVAEQKFPHTMDAAVWAAEFVKLHPGADEGDMIGWFANAIMAGYDTATSRCVPSPQAKPSVPQLGVRFCDGCEWEEECGEAGECLCAMKVKP